MGPLPKLLGLLVILQFGDVQGGVCCTRAGGVVVNGQCLTFNKASGVTWTKALNACASVDGGRLAQFHDTYKAWQYLNTYHLGITYAIGATYNDIEDTWEWLDGTSFVLNPPWKVGWKHTNNARKWLWVRGNTGYGDDVIGYRGQGYICEIARCNACGCGFTLNKGCFLNAPKPQLKACQCLLTGNINVGQTGCVGTIVPCKAPMSKACIDTGTSEAECKQGVKNGIGNCGGYSNVTNTQNTRLVGVRRTQLRRTAV